MNPALPNGHAANVFRRAAALMGQPWSGVDVETFDMLSALLGPRMADVGELAQWPELTHSELRLAKQPWSYGDSYTRGTTRVHVPSNGIWQVVDAGGVTGDEEPGVSDKWVRVKRDYKATAYDPAKVYTYGNQAYWAATQATYVYVNRTDTSAVNPTNTSHWTPLETAGDFPLIDVLAVGEEMGAIYRVTPDDPRAFDVEGGDLEFWLTGSGVRVQNDPGSAWFVFCENIPNLCGTMWNTTTPYLVGAQVYFESGGLGHFYDALSASTNIEPGTDGAVWQKVVWPQKFEAALAFGLYADWLRMDGLTDKSERAEALLIAETDRLLENLVRHQKQHSRTRVNTR